jgi:hypothetical protein
VGFCCALPRAQSARSVFVAFQDAAWFLEHKYPDRWARVEKRADQHQPFTIIFSDEVKDV